jgi:hypothetical protein
MIHARRGTHNTIDRVVAVPPKKHRDDRPVDELQGFVHLLELGRSRGDVLNYLQQNLGFGWSWGDGVIHFEGQNEESRPTG